MRNDKWTAGRLEGHSCHTKRRGGRLVLFMLRFSVALWGILILSCSKQKPGLIADAQATQEDTETKQLLQGVWYDSATDEVFFMAEGDTIYFADGTSQPAYFRIVGDSIVLGANAYFITKRTEHNFWFLNHAGDEVQLVKKDESEEQPQEFISEEPEIITTTEVVNLDSVVNYDGQRYHWYITVNPTRYRVTRTSFTPEGVAVEKIFYDNIIHVSVFKGGQRLFTRDFNKQAYAQDVPADFLGQSILGNIRYSHVDAQGFHFNATICIPDGEQCYMVENLIGFNGQLSQKLLEY